MTKEQMVEMCANTLTDAKLKPGKRVVINQS
jgi:hypothetical protein